MVKEFKFPDVGEGITEGELIRWLVKQGDPIAEHQPLAEIETDKAVVTIPSPYTGTVQKLNGKPGEIIPVGAVLAVIGEGGEPLPAAAKPAGAPPAARKDAGSVVGKLEEAPDDDATQPPARPSAPAAKAAAAPEIKATPQVRALAKERGIDLAKVKGSGPDGRILAQDLDRAAGHVPAKPAATAATVDGGPIEELPLRGVRRASAKHVAESAARVAAVTIVDDADVSPLEAVRQKERHLLEQKGAKLTYLPFIMKAVVAGLKQYPILNSSLDEDRDVILIKKYYHIGIAIDTPDGLMVYVIRDADTKSIMDLALAMHELGERAANRTIELAQLKGGTFTITNYGVIGGNYGTPIINYPEAAILGIGKIGDRAVVRDGQIVARRILPLSLTFDHRIIHGAEAARFLNSVVQHLEDPNLMLIEGR